MVLSTARSTCRGRSTSRAATATPSRCWPDRRAARAGEREWQIKRTGVRDGVPLARQGPDSRRPSASRARGSPSPPTAISWSLHADVLLDLAEVLRLAGRPEQAATAAAEAAGLYERKGNVAGTARARDLVGSLG